MWIWLNGLWVVDSIASPVHWSAIRQVALEFLLGALLSFQKTGPSPSVYQAAVPKTFDP